MQQFVRNGRFTRTGSSQDAIAMTRRFTMRSLITRRLRSSKPPRRLVVALIMLAVFLTVAAPGTAFALHRVDPHRHRLLHALHLTGLRRLLWNPMFRPSHD